MFKSLSVLLLLITISLLLADGSARKARITTTDGTTQDLLIIGENSDSIKVKVLESTIAISKNSISSITYIDQPVTLEKMDQKLDTLITLQKTHVEDQKYNPLKNKNYGLELSTIGLLTLGQENGFMSGGFSLFRVDRSAEIIFPVTYSWMKDWDNKSALTVDMQYRKFLGFFDNIQNGLYLSALLSYAHTQGTRHDDQYNYQTHSYDYTYKKYNNDLLGFGFGLGYRRFSYSGWYWGTGLIVGRYINADEDFYEESMTSGRLIGEYFFDFEILKFGWSF